MTATKQTVYGQYQAYISDASTVANIFTDLAGALNTEKVAPRDVILFDVVSKIAIYTRSGA